MIAARYSHRVRRAFGPGLLSPTCADRPHRTTAMFHVKQQMSHLPLTPRTGARLDRAPSKQCRAKAPQQPARTYRVSILEQRTTTGKERGRRGKPVRHRQGTAEEQDAGERRADDRTLQTPVAPSHPATGFGPTGSTNKCTRPPSGSPGGGTPHAPATSVFRHHPHESKERSSRRCGASHLKEPAPPRGDLPHLSTRPWRLRRPSSALKPDPKYQRGGHCFT